MSAQSPQPADQGTAGMTRRGLLARGGTVATGAALTIGVGDRVVPRYSPVGRAQAIALTAATVYVGVGALAGIGIAAWMSDEPDLDPEDVLEDQIYEAGASVADGREEFVAEMEHEFLSGESNPFERSGWQAIRAAAVREIIDGGSASAAQSAAKEAIDEQATRSIVNATERWNTGIKALIQQIVAQEEEGMDVLTPDDTSQQIGAVEDWSHAMDSDQFQGAEPVEAAESEDYAGTPIWEIPVDTPVAASSLEDRDEDLSLYFLAAGDYDYPWYPIDNDFYGLSSGASWPLIATHSDLGDTTVLDAGLFTDVFDEIAASYQTMTSDLGEYCQRLHDGIQQGAVDPTDVLSPQDLADEFADSNAQTRLAVELTAIGAQVPDEAGYRAEISHPDLEAETLTGHLFPQFDGEAMNLSAGMTLQPEDYNMAYFGYEPAYPDEDEEDPFETVILSGEDPLEIHALDGLEGQVSIEEGESGDTAGTNGRVLLWTGDDPPDPIAQPSEHDGWQVIVQGETTQHVASVSDVVEDGDEWVLESTSLAEGEAIETVEVVPSVEYSRTIDHVADPTNVDSEETLARIENLRQQIDDLEEALEEEDDTGITFPNPFDGDGGGLLGLGIIAVVLLTVVGFVMDLIPGLGD